MIPALLHRLSLALNLMALVLLIVAHLALTDIHHGEADLRLEWMVVQFCGLWVIVSVAVSIVSTIRALRS